jgi:hypothetical protein
VFGLYLGATMVGPAVETYWTLQTAENSVPEGYGLPRSSERQPVHDEIKQNRLEPLRVFFLHEYAPPGPEGLWLLIVYVRAQARILHQWVFARPLQPCGATRWYKPLEVLARYP